MKALYLPLSYHVIYFTFNVTTTNLGTYLGTQTFSASQVLSKSFPSVSGVPRTKDAYTEQHFFNSEDLCIGTIREGNFETLQKLQNPFHPTTNENAPLTKPTDPQSTRREDPTPKQTRSIHKETSVEPRTRKPTIIDDNTRVKRTRSELQQLQKERKAQTRRGKGSNRK